MKRLDIFSLILLAAACKNAFADPLAGQRKTCQELSARKQLKAGISIDDCVKELQSADSRIDAGKQAEELTSRVQQLVATLHQRRDPAQVQQLQVVVGKLQKLGKAAVSPALSMMTTTIDPDLRAPLARVLTSACASDCAAHQFECIVPALLEGTSPDKPADVRKDSAIALAHCTGEKIGTDPDAWRTWWEAREARGSRAR